MRVIAGIYRRLNLQTPSGRDTRPTLDRVKEALFSIINLKINEAVVLDLFAGSGGLGIEALSRGAQKVYFNDCSQEALSSIKHNLTFIKAPKETYQVLDTDYLKAITYLQKQQICFDIILLDPPYLKMDYLTMINQIISSNILKDKALIVLEMPANNDIEVFYPYKEYQYGDVKILIIEYTK